MFKQLVKKTFLIALLIITSFFPFSLKGEQEPVFDLIIEEEVEHSLYGVSHKKIIGKISLNGVLTNQQINYTAANIKENENLFAVTGDNYLKHDYGMSNLRAQTYNVNQSYLNQGKVISGVNGDFFDIRGTVRTGLSSGAYIRDYRTINEGNTSRPLIGVHDDGTVNIAAPEYKGYEVIVLDDSNSKKDYQIKVAGFNRLPEEGEVTAFFANNDGPIVSPEPKMVFSGVDVKEVGAYDRYFGEGFINMVTTEEYEVSHGEFVLMGDAIFTDNLITENDTVLVQNVLGGVHEGIRHGLSGGHILLRNGEIVDSDNTDVHPRTAIGIKDDGTLIFVTVDGRQTHANMDGVDYEQLSHLMKYFGASEAINVDGGGSTTMLFYDEETDYYETQNSPSDNPHSLRAVSNGFFFVYGNLEKQLPPSPFPDTRDVLEMPSQFYFDNNQTLNFNAVDNALYYILTVNDGVKYRTETNNIDLNELSSGEYDFKIQAFGDFELYKQSNINSYQVTIYTNPILDLIDGLKEYAQNANNK